MKNSKLVILAIILIMGLVIINYPTFESEEVKVMRKCAEARHNG